MMFCVFGLFNLIFAIYIETTLAAARKQRKMDKSETVRVARLARELLKKFALAQALLEPMSKTSFRQKGSKVQRSQLLCLFSLVQPAVVVERICIVVDDLSLCFGMADSLL
eukprot:1583357-Amphidinium_carterae.1